MSPLSAKARAVIGAGRGALQPGPGDRERLEALLDARLASAATASSTGATLSTAVKAGLVGIGAAIVGGSVALALRWPDEVAPPAGVPKVAVSALMTTAAPPSPPPAASVEPIEAIAKSTTEPTPATPRSPKDQLALEVALLSRATSALRSGRAADALKLLDEHKRQFPGGFLAVDRRAARAQALCSLKRVTEGRAELARLEPESPAAERTRRVCDAVAAKRDQP